jgi:hypothetical protein
VGEGCLLLRRRSLVPDSLCTLLSIYPSALLCSSASVLSLSYLICFCFFFPLGREERGEARCRRTFCGRGSSHGRERESREFRALNSPRTTTTMPCHFFVIFAPNSNGNCKGSSDRKRGMHSGLHQRRVRIPGND